MMYHGKRYDASDVSNIEEFKIQSSKLQDGTMSVSDLLKELSFCATSGDVRNALSGNSVRVNGAVITDAKFLVTISSEGTLIEMGKKKAKRVFI